MTHRSTTPKIERLYAVLADGDWHSTKELVRRVGHTFAGAKRQLTLAGYTIEKRPHPHRRHQWQYRMEA